MENSRDLAVQILARIEAEQAYANIILDTELQKASLRDPRDKALTTEIVYGVLRWQKRLDWYLDQVCKKPMQQAPPWLRHILRVGSYQILMLDKIPPSAAINESVKLADKYRRKLKLPAHTAKGVVNGILRQLHRSLATLRAPETIPDKVTRLAVQSSYPEWLVKRWFQRLGEQDAEACCRIQNQPSHLMLRVNPFKTSCAALQKSLAEYAGNITPLPDPLNGLVLDGAPAFAELQCYQRGECTLQNAASMLVSQILDPKPRESILEACAGAGIKTTHIGELMENDGKITAVDIHENKLIRLQENCQRIGISIVRAYQGDMTTQLDLPAPHFQDGQGFDRILVDAPCSGLGVLRKHPEAKWTVEEHHIHPLQHLQLQILNQSVSLLNAQHGVLVYSTCTTEPEENEDVIAQFLQDHPGFEIESPQKYLPRELHACITSQGFLRIEPPHEYFDGFFCAKLVRTR